MRHFIVRINKYFVQKVELVKKRNEVYLKDKKTYIISFAGRKIFIRTVVSDKSDECSDEPPAAAVGLGVRMSGKP